MGHLQTGPAEAALDVETLVGLAAVQDALVAADVGGDVVEGLDEAEAELLALLVAGNGNVLDVADGTEAVDAVWGMVVSTPLLDFLRSVFHVNRVGGTYNLRSTISAPVATTGFSARDGSSITMM